MEWMITVSILAMVLVNLIDMRRRRKEIDNLELQIRDMHLFSMQRFSDVIKEFHTKHVDFSSATPEMLRRFKEIHDAFYEFEKEVLSTNKEDTSFL